MKVESVLAATGMITGAYGKEPATLKQVRGVAGVEASPVIQLPPPDSDVQ